MNTRERMMRTLCRQPADHVPDMEFGYWPETIDVWHQQGLSPDCLGDVALEVLLGIEGFERISWVPIRNGMFPCCERKILEDRGNTLLIMDHEGNVCEVGKSGASIPRFVRHAIQNRTDWENFKGEHLDYTDPARIGNVKEFAAGQHAAGMPVRFDAGSLYGWIRNWMGVENLSIAVMEDPAWVAEMMDHLMRMTLYLIEKGLDGVEVDVAWWWEDMCYNAGPLLSPRTFQQLMVPRYKEITSALRAKGIEINILDCDGSIHKLVPGWIEAGITGMFPLEAVWTDPFKLREEFNERVLLIGGVNKRELAKDRVSIDRELERLAPLLAQGGFIPCVDHRVPPDVPYENYLYYLAKKREMLGIPNSR